MKISATEHDDQCYEEDLSNEFSDEGLGGEKDPRLTLEELTQKLSEIENPESSEYIFYSRMYARVLTLVSQKSRQFSANKFSSQMSHNGGNRPILINKKAS